MQNSCSFQMLVMFRRKFKLQSDILRTFCKMFKKLESNACIFEAPNRTNQVTFSCYRYEIFVSIKIPLLFQVESKS